MASIDKITFNSFTAKADPVTPSQVYTMGAPSKDVGGGSYILPPLCERLAWRGLKHTLGRLIIELLRLPRVQVRALSSISLPSFLCPAMSPILYPMSYIQTCVHLRTYHTELDHGQVRRELHQALEIWSRHSNLTFREMNSDDADIIIKFHRREHGDGYAFDGRGNILAHAFFPGEDRGGDVHFDDDETWLLEYQHKEDGQ
ncbi:collagenase 3-like [Homalodisca vitripennis]|uniref:collagenase 3-like n=1 Tax=Homalodisca vitripennis TaxID=197043 RepID=UPI001EEB0CBE|nr:collagenase 3-like [Homalodisca vitripennis]